MFKKHFKSRNAVRIPSFGRAEILNSDGWVIQRCVVKEVSRTGLSLVADNPRTLPDKCEIWIPHLNLKVRGCVRWRKKNRAGLEFDRPVDGTSLV